MFGTSIVQAVQSSKYLLETLKAHCTDLSCSHVEGKTAEASGKISYTGVQPRHLVFEHSLGSRSPIAGIGDAEIDVCTQAGNFVMPMRPRPWE